MWLGLTMLSLTAFWIICVIICEYMDYTMGD